MKKNKKALIVSAIALIIVIVGICVVFALTNNTPQTDNTETTSATLASDAQSSDVQTQDNTEQNNNAEQQNSQQTVAQQSDANNQSGADNQADAETQAQTQQQFTNSGPVMPNIVGIWKHEKNPDGCTVEITTQDQNDLYFTITSVKGNASQIATANVNVILETTLDGELVRGESDFDYVDSFGNSGTGTISVSENVIVLVVNEDYNSGAGWGLKKVTGKYYQYN